MDNYDLATSDDRDNKESFASDDTVEEIAAALDEGDLLRAMQLNNQLWKEGGDLSSSSKIFYIECLLDMGQLERASILLDPVLQNMGEYVEDYWPVIIKYSMLSGRLSLAASLGEYAGVRGKMEALFLWLKQHQDNYSLRFYGQMFRLAFAEVRNQMCAFDLLVLEDDSIEGVFYTVNSPEENQLLAEKVQQKIIDYFTDLNRDTPDDLTLSFDNVENH